MLKTWYRGEQVEGTVEEMLEFVRIIHEDEIPEQHDFKFPVATCPKCGSNHVHRHGWGKRKYAEPVQRFRCLNCSHWWRDGPKYSKRDPAVVATALRLHLEGKSYRQIQRHLLEAEHTKVSHVAIFKWIHAPDENRAIQEDLNRT